MADAPTSSASETRGESLGSKIATLARAIARDDDFGPEAFTAGDKAALRRLDPGDVDDRHRVALARAMARVDETRAPHWPLIINSIALARGRHTPKVPFGAALRALDGENGRTLRLTQLLSADLATLVDLGPRVARRLAAAEHRANWTDFAWLVLTADQESDAHDRARQRIADAWVRGSIQPKQDPDAQTKEPAQ